MSVMGVAGGWSILSTWAVGCWPQPPLTPTHTGAV